MDVTLTPRRVLFYDYGTEGVLERRAPHRAAHLELLREALADGRMLMGGALGDPPTGGLLVFATDDLATVEAFAAADPYVREGVALSWRTELWSVVT